MASFELALVQSLVLQFPNSEIQGCFFHFFQYLWMKVQFIGLTDLYKNDPVTRCFIWKSAALAFVPLPIAWSGVNADVPAIPKGDALVDYFQKRPGLMVTSFWKHGITIVRNAHTQTITGRMAQPAEEGSKKAYPYMFELIKRLQNRQAARNEHPAVLRRRKILFKEKKRDAAWRINQETDWRIF